VAEATISFTNSTGGALSAGARIDTASWASGINHASLVTAWRSRSDGYDLRFWHTTYGDLTWNVNSVNVSTMKLEWYLPAGMNNGAVDTGYRLTFGNLGAQTSPFTALTGGTKTGTATATLPSLSLPDGSIGESFVYTHDVDANDALSPRRGLRNQNTRRVWSIEWEHLSPEDWYELRAFVREYRGTAGKWTAPAWFQRGVGNDVRFAKVPSLAQTSRLGYHASAVVEEVII
jgi:hypothetical protein